MATISAEFEIMPVLKKAVTSSVLFDFDEADKAFETLGLDAIEQQPVFVDYLDACSESERPIHFISRAILKAISENVQNEDRLRDIYSGLKEIVGDIEKHADKTEPAILVLNREIGGVAIHSFSTENGVVCEWKQDSGKDVDCDNDMKTYGRGEVMLGVFFRGNYASIKEGKAFERHIFIPDDGVVQLPRIRHDD